MKVRIKEWVFLFEKFSLACVFLEEGFTFGLLPLSVNKSLALISNYPSTYFHIGTPSSADELSFNLFADYTHIRFPGSRIGDRGSWIVD